MRFAFKEGDRVTLSERGMRGVRKAERVGTVVGAARTGTRYLVQWDDVKRPQMLHGDLLAPEQAGRTVRG